MAGTYRMQSVMPKNDDAFIGEGKVVMNGSELLSPSSNSTTPGLYVANAAAIPASPGICDSTHHLCVFPQDLFIDGNLQTQVDNLEAVKQGTWYYDRVRNRVYFPSIQETDIVELGRTSYAFYGQVSGVKIEKITVERYATPGHAGAVGGYHGGARWTIDHVESRWNHGVGICLGPGSQLLNSYIHNNGQMGICIIGGENSKVINNEISWNNYANFSTDWEAGGSKFSATKHLIVRSNYVHDNKGAGLWADTDNFDTLYENNTVVNNSCSGIMHEVSYHAVVRANTVKGNGSGPRIWMGNAQIQVQNSSDVEIYGNTIEVPIEGGNGIALVNHGYSGKVSGPWTARGYVHDNAITYLGPEGASGAVDDTGGETAIGNHFDFDHYVIQNGGVNHWRWFGHNSLNWGQFVAAGQETHGTLREK
jgi:parallel beta-helix repeat protein